MASIWDYVFDHEFKQRRDIEEMRARIRRRERSRGRHLRELEQRVEALEDELGEMRLFTRATLALLQENGTLDAAAIRARIQALDASDGSADGRLGRPEAGDAAPPPAPAPAPRRRRR